MKHNYRDLSKTRWPNLLRFTYQWHRVDLW